MGWNEIERDREPLATKDQRRLVHVGCSEMNSHRDYAKLLTVAEADQLIKVFLAVRERAGKENVVAD